MTRKLVVILVTWLIAAAATPAQAIGTTNVIIEVEIFSDHGPIHHGAVTVRGSGHLSTHKIVEGSLDLELPEGVYELAFSKRGYYDVVLSGVPIEKPASGTRDRPPSKALRVKMVPRLYFEQDLVIIGPRYVEAPPLTVAFRPIDPAIVGQPARGILTLTNVGNETFMLPLDPELGGIPDNGWAMSVSLEIEGLHAAYYVTFVCKLPRGCHLLGPGESVEIPVHLISRRGYGRGQIEPTTWGGSGTYAAAVQIYVAHPSIAGEKQPTHTRSVKTEFWLTIQDEPGDPQ